MNVLLTGAGGSAAANVLASLRLAGGYRVIGVDASAVHLHLSEADERYVVPRSSEPEYIEALQTLSATLEIELIHPQPDGDVLVIGAHRDLLPNTFLPSQQALETSLDKLALAELLAEASVPIPEVHDFADSVGSVEDVTSDLLSRHSRVWVRARQGAGSRASLPVRDARAASSWIRWWADERGLRPSQFMVSEFLPGREFAYQGVWRNGVLVAGQARERVEYLYGHLTPHGQTSTPAVARTVSNPDVDRVAAAAVEAVDPTPQGIFGVDMKEAADGSIRVTEVNAGRFFTTSNFLAAAGLNLPDLFMRVTRGEAVEQLGSSPLEADLYWIRMVDMGYVLVPGRNLDVWPRAGA